MSPLDSGKRLLRGRCSIDGTYNQSLTVRILGAFWCVGKNVGKTRRGGYNAIPDTGSGRIGDHNLVANGRDCYSRVRWEFLL